MNVSLRLLIATPALCAAIFAQDSPKPKPVQREVGKPAVVEEKKTATQLRAEKIIIPKVDLREVTAREALDFVALKSRQFDPNEKGINVIGMLEPPRTQKVPAAPRKGPP